MPVTAERLDALLHLGERIAEAAEADDWDRVAGLLDRRARIVDALTPAPDASGASAQESGLSEGTLRRKKNALADQHETLLALLREREEEIEAELGQVQRLQSANDSYEDHAASPASDGGNDGVLPPELSG